MKSDLPAKQQSAEAADSLNVAITEYTERCRFLGESLLGQRTSPQDLSTWVDSSLESFEQQVSLARSRMTITRNRLISPICRIPDEVLLEIFTLVVYTLHHWLDRMHYPMGESLIDVYRSLYNLLGVCSKWRTLALSKGIFWSIVPIMKKKHSFHHKFTTRHPCRTRLSLERAGSGDLHLGVVLPDLAIEDDHDLTEFAPRFRSVNISCRAHQVIRSTLDHFLSLGSSSRLDELSVFFQSKELNTIPQESDYVFRDDDPKQLLFGQLVKSLSIMRVRGANFHLDVVLPSSRLVELHLQGLTLGHDSKLAELLVVLSSVASLRHLKLISLITFPNHELVQGTISSSNDPFSGLQTLLLQDLYANTLQLLLSYISSRTYRFTLFLNEKCSYVRSPGVPRPEIVGIQELVGLPGCSSVNTLMMNWTMNGRVPPEHIQLLVSSMISIETLEVLGWDFSKELSSILSRPTSVSGSERPFPRVQNLHVYSSIIEDTQSFKAMVASHAGSLERMIFGGGIEKDVCGEMELEDFEPEDELVIWLQDNVRRFTLTGWGYEPGSFSERPIWPLW